MQLIQSCTDRLRELAGVIQQLSDDQYSTQLPVLNGASPGAHVRHVIEFYQCLLAQYPEGWVNYDLRNRDQRLETSTAAAGRAIEVILSVLTSAAVDKPLRLSASFCYEDEQPIAIGTSLYRELVYQLEHTIHHMALLRVGIAHSYPHVIIPEHFGVAPSTVRNSLKSLER